MDTNQPVLLQGMELLPEYVLLDMDAKTSQEAIEMLAEKLVNQGAVKPSFIPAILKREEDYCTGLDFEEMSIALPHTDPIHVNKPCIAIGVLRKPVVFQSMGMPDVPCNVEIVIMLGITEPHAQLDFLRSLMQAFQTPGRLKALKACTTSQQLLETFKSYFSE